MIENSLSSTSKHLSGYDDLRNIILEVMEEAEGVSNR